MPEPWYRIPEGTPLPTTLEGLADEAAQFFNESPDDDETLPYVQVERLAVGLAQLTASTAAVDRARFERLRQGVSELMVYVELLTASGRDTPCASAVRERLRGVLQTDLDPLP